MAQHPEGPDGDGSEGGQDGCSGAMTEPTANEGHEPSVSASASASDAVAADAPADLAQLAQDLSDQPWHEIGNCSHPIGATDDFDTMVDQLTAVLSYRLVDVVASRPLSAKEFLDSVRQESLSDASESGRSDGGSDGSDASQSSGRPQQRRRRLRPSLQSNLRSYVAAVGREYNAVPFHSLEHAAHVTVSMNKLISMLIQPEDVAGGYDSGSDCAATGTATDHGSQHSFRRRSTIQHVAPCPGEVRPPSPVYDDDQTAAALTFGIGTDPLIKFALVFACLIHDVGHRGVPNATLVDEEDGLAILHNDVSVAEQNSLSIAFQCLLRDEFGPLKRCIMPDKEARKAFRKQVIDIVLSTDISSPERMQVTKSRWREAFEPESVTPEVIEVRPGQEQDGLADVDDGVGEAERGGVRRLSNESAGTAARRHTMYSSRKSMMHLNLHSARNIGMRHSLQLGGKLIDVYSDSDDDGGRMLRRHAVVDAMTNVADVAHTMQAFHVFVKWNRRLYAELLLAYHRGRIGWDPTVGWHENQINFFDAYILPLAEKLDACGAFGSKSSVFLYFATENKRRWGLEGDRITEEMVDEIGREMLARTVAEAAASAVSDDDGRGRSDGGEDGDGGDESYR